LDEYDTNVDGTIKSNVNLGFGSETVDPFSPSRVKKSISDLDVFGSASPILGKRSRTEVETPLSTLAPSPFSQIDGRDPLRGGGTRSAFQDYVRFPDPSRTPSRYPRSPSRSQPKRSSPPCSHSCLPNYAMVMGAVETTDGVNARPSGRGGMGGLRRVPGEEQRVEFRLSPADVQSHLGEDEQVKIQEPPGAATVEVGTSDLNNLSPGSSPSDPGIRGCSPTTDSLSPRTEVLFGSSPSQVLGDQGTGCALRRRLRQGGLNEIATEKMKMDVEECGNHLGGVGSMRGYRPSRQLSVVSIDGLDDDEEFDCAGLGGVLDWAGRISRADVSRVRDTPGSRCPSPSCSTHGFCADADVESGSRGPVGSYSTILPRSRHHRSGLSSDRGSVPGPHLRRHVKGQTVDGVLSPGSRSRSGIHHQTSTSSPFKASIPSFSSTPLEEAPYIYDTRVFHDNTKPGTGGNGSWFIQTHEFDPLRFSSPSPSRSILGSASSSISASSHPLLDDKDKLDENTDSEASGCGPGFIGHLINGELRSYVTSDMTSDSSTRTGLNEGADGALFNCNAQGRPLASFINDLGDDDGSVSRHVDGIEQRDMGGLEHEGLGPLDHCGRASLISGSVSGSVPRVSGVSVAGSLFSPALGTRLHSNEDTRLPASLDSPTTSIQSRPVDRGEEEDLEECGLLKSLLESSDPWGLMRKKVLNLPSPTPSEVERRSRREQEDMVVVRGSLGRRGVGYVTPPSMDTLLGEVDLGGEVEMKDLEECGGDDEDSQEILDFHSSQPRTSHFPTSVGQAE